MSEVKRWTVHDIECEAFPDDVVFYSSSDYAALREEVEFHRNALERTAKAAGVTTPLILIGMAENNEQSYADLLVKFVETLRAQLAALEEAARELNRLVQELEREIDRLKESLEVKP